MFDIAKLSKAIKNEQDGFTLVELMVVVVIIGVLVAIAIPVYNTVTERAEENAHDANIRTIQGAVMMYQSAEDTQQDPSIDDLVPEYLDEWPEAPGDQNRDDYLDYVSDSSHPQD